MWSPDGGRMRRTSSLKLSRRVRLSAGGGGGGGGSGTVVSAHPATRLERCLRSVFLGLSQGRLTCHGAARHQGVLNAGMARSPSKSCCDAPCWQAGVRSVPGLDDGRHGTASPNDCSRARRSRLGCRGRSECWRVSRRVSRWQQQSAAARSLGTRRCGRLAYGSGLRTPRPRE
jgi:hypothetical protein